MYRRYALSMLASILLAVLVGGCASAGLSVQESLADYEEDLARLHRQLALDADDQIALRDIGVIYIRTNNPDKSIGYLKRSFDLGNRDAKLLFYLAFARESLGRPSEALPVYAMYSDMSRANPYRQLMSGRFYSLSREMAAESVRRSLESDEQIPASEIAENALAVFALGYDGTDDQYANFGRGLAEWIMLDLIQVARLRVLERVRLQALLDELELQETGYVDPETAPRAGRLLRAGRVVSGSYSILSDERLQVTTAHVETSTSSIETLPSLTDDLAEFYRIEKQIVFTLLDDLGIELTEAERRAIEEVPTRDLQAFLAYCRGLASEDRRNFDVAADWFEQASELDPEFESAASRAIANRAISAAGGSGGETLARAIAMEPSITLRINPVIDRLTSMGSTIGALHVPGTDSRKPSVESGIFLAEPPPPPENR